MLCGNSIDCRGSWSSSQLHRLHPLLQCCPIRLEHAINEWWGQLKANPALHQVSSNLATNHLLCCNRYAISDWSSVCWVNNLQPHLHSFVGNVCCCCSDSSDSRPRECRSFNEKWRWKYPWIKSCLWWPFFRSAIESAKEKRTHSAPSILQRIISRGSYSYPPLPGLNTIM